MPGSAVHIQRVGYGREHTRTQVALSFDSGWEHGANLLHKVHANYAGDCPVRPSIADVAPIVGEASPDIVIHAPSNAQYTHTLPSGEIVISIGRCGFFSR